eukprot:TRINITY_DN580_c0_g2_i1.p1 TRINITY_DN580_c0_g2~~TRINITY_DN580_c0_g2_i1.p1  ORF type:complete len:1264 (+),score=732.79 TRINITY_DN580_c0_g2_i1:136-3927(+)
MPKAGQPAWKDVLKQEGLDDMTLLTKVNNENILQNLKERFEADIIYTNIGDVLISVNPFKWIDIYGEEVLQDYVGKVRIEMPPHIFSISEAAYRSMLAEKENQCVIISGESGAGKTEAAKKIMQYVAAVSGGDAKGQAQLEKIKNIILETNPLLEAFGNAKTLRNNNSSRFGKYFEIQFDTSGNPDGGCITNYLLEKSRIVFQAEGERNFHIFYQFCKAASQKEKEEFGLSGPEGFYYISQGNCMDVDTVDDYQEWADMRRAMTVIGLTPQEQNSIFTLVAIVLWIGNIDFNEQGEKATVADPSVLEYVASLLSIPAPFLKNAIEIREVETKHGQQRGTTYKVPLNKVQAAATRDALAKAIYSRLFDWLVVRVNSAMHKPGTGLSIGVLDIYGFEVFQKNGFEQLCINYVNEKLQQIFIEFTLKLEQEEYVKEGIKWTEIKYFNNKIVLDLIEAKSPPGIFCVLDDVARSVHSQAEGADKALCQRITSCSTNPHFDMRGQSFCVKHYAGDVTYEVQGMIEKNKDSVLKDLLEAISISQNKFLLTLFPDRPDEDAKKGPTTAGFKIKTQAGNLVATLSKAMPHYVRCIKPNDTKKAGDFDNQRILHQIKYLGLLDNIKVRRAGFAYRTTFDRFIERFYLLSGRTSYAAKKIWKGDTVSGCRAILEDSPVGPDEWQIGKTKVFLRHPETLFTMEDLRINYYHNMCDRIKNAYKNFKSFKGFCVNRIKKAFLNWRRYKIECTTTLQRCWRTYKDCAPYYDIRIKNETNFANKKERHRFSITSVRRYFGDYLVMKTQQKLLEAMGQGAHENVLFSAKSKIVVSPGILRADKLSPRFLILTVQALYLIMLVKRKNLIVHQIDRRIPINAITGCTLSPFSDNYVVLHCTPPEWDVVIETDFKTELVAWLTSKGSVSRVDFNEKINYLKKKQSKKSLSFIKDERFKPALFKKDKVMVAAGLAASSSVARTKMRDAGTAGRKVVEVEYDPDANKPQYGNAGRKFGPRVAGALSNDDAEESSGAVGGQAGGATPKGATGRGGAGNARGGGGGGTTAAAPRGGGVTASRGPAITSTAPVASRGPGVGASSVPKSAPPGAPRGTPPATGNTSAPAAGGVKSMARGMSLPNPAGANRGPALAAPAANTATASAASTANNSNTQPRASHAGTLGPRTSSGVKGAVTKGSPTTAASTGGVVRGGAPGRGPLPSPVKSAPSKAGPKCKALYFYDAQHDDELTFKEGDIISILGKDGDWWTGELRGAKGLFPANYVEEC